MTSFIKMNRDSELSDYLAINHPNAFILLYFIAKRARRTEGSPDGLHIGESHLGDWEAMGLTEQKYRTAKKVLCQYNILTIIETNRTRKKSTTGSTTTGTKVKLLRSDIWDINAKLNNVSSNDCLTTDQRLPNDEQECKEYKECKESNNIPTRILFEKDNITYIISRDGRDVVVVVDFSKLKELKLTNDQITVIKKQFVAKELCQKNLDHAIEASKHISIKTTLLQFIIWASEVMPDFIEKPDSEKNRAIAQKYAETWHAKNYILQVCNSYVELTPQSGTISPIVLALDSNNFEDNLRKNLIEKQFIQINQKHKVIA